MLRLYASTASTVDDRSQSIGYFSCGQAIGAILGPVFQLAFSLLKFPGYQIYGLFNLNIYTAPAYCAILADIIGIIVLYTLFKEDYAGIVEKSIDDSCEKDNYKSMEVPKYDIVAVYVCLLTRFAHTFFLANIETIGSAFSMHMFAFSHTKAVKYMAGSQTAVSILTFFVYLVFTLNNLKSINLRCICISSVKVMILFYLLTYSYPFYSGQIKIRDASINISHGCPADKFTWCKDLSLINVYLYYAVYVSIIGFAFPTLNIVLITLYSTVLGPRRQGTLQGIFQISGGTARMLGPFVLGNLYDSHGPKMTWKLEFIVLGITAVIWILFYHRMC
uniref:Uncharacterized protein n=1 Tax=Panagrolaimus superbus TaxID=310955 RepID=A0A914Y5V2_9BILA